MERSRCSWEGEMPVRIKVKYIEPACRFGKIKQGDWIDLRADSDHKLGFLEFRIIKLGFCMEMPNGYEAHIEMRSSTFKEWGIVKAGSGIIDNSFKGDNDVWGFPVLCLRSGGTEIKKGDRICQFRIVTNQPELQVIEVEELGNQDRGGWGSTGRR